MARAMSGWPALVAMQLFGFAHVDQLPATAQKIAEARTGGAERYGGWQVQRRAHLGQHAGIDPVGLCRRTGGSGDVARLAWIDAREGVTAYSQGGDQIAVAAAGGFKNDTDIVVERVEPDADGIRCIGDPVSLSRRQIAGIDKGARGRSR